MNFSRQGGVGTANWQLGTCEHYQHFIEDRVQNVNTIKHSLLQWT